MDKREKMMYEEGKEDAVLGKAQMSLDAAYMTGYQDGALLKLKLSQKLGTKMFKNK